MKLISKTIITGTITVETGMHIGGSKSSLDIGGLDSPVIKTPLGVPYIPGSSLKGKLRSLLAMQNGGSLSVDQDATFIKKLFGYPGKGNSEPGEVTRLIVRDAHLNEADFQQKFNASEVVLETRYTQEKAENTIDRKSGKAANPRFIERVPVGARFDFELVLNNFEGDDYNSFIQLIQQGFRLLEDDYLGGSGTRGYGKVKIASNIHQPVVKTYS